jgi:hypothetical protein
MVIGQALRLKDGLILVESITHGIMNILMNDMEMRSDINLKGHNGHLIHDVDKIVTTLRVGKLGHVIPNSVPARTTLPSTSRRPNKDGLDGEMVIDIHINYELVDSRNRVFTAPDVLAV